MNLDGGANSNFAAPSILSACHMLTMMKSRLTPMLAHFRKRYAGIEISPTSVKLAQVEKAKDGWRLLHFKRVPLPAAALEASFRAQNIQDEASLSEALREALADLDGRLTRVGLSIPNENVKLSIQKFDALPGSRPETEKMIAWWAEKTFRFPPDTAQISFQPLGPAAGDSQRLLVSIGNREVIREYERAFKRVKLDAEVIRPARINQFNFYRSLLPNRGTIAYLGLFENFFCLFVFEDARLTFYHGVKRGFSNLHFFQDVDMTMQHYLGLNPDGEIEKLFVGSQVGFHRELEEVFKNLSDMKVEILDENSLMSIQPEAPPAADARTVVGTYAAAIGAAQSLSLIGE